VGASVCKAENNPGLVYGDGCFVTDLGALLS